MGHRMDSKFRPSGHFARAKSTVLRKPTTSARSKFLSAQPRRYVNPYPSKTIILHTEKKIRTANCVLKVIFAHTQQPQGHLILFKKGTIFLSNFFTVVENSSKKSHSLDQSLDNFYIPRPVVK